MENTSKVLILSELQFKAIRTVVCEMNNINAAVDSMTLQGLVDITFNTDSGYYAQIKDYENQLEEVYYLEDEFFSVYSLYYGLKD